MLYSPALLHRLSLLIQIFYQFMRNVDNSRPSGNAILSPAPAPAPASPSF